jgi:hypothetical protein
LYCYLPFPGQPCRNHPKRLMKKPNEVLCRKTTSIRKRVSFHTEVTGIPKIKIRNFSKAGCF